jgi:two-component system sensor histidine kinase CpxA
VKTRFPLFAKILLWFFLNIALLLAVIYAFARAQYRIGLDSLLLGPAGSRVEILANLVGQELGETERDEWESVLARFSAGYKVNLGLFNLDGGKIAGNITNLPPAVVERLRGQVGARRPPPRDDGPPPGPPDEFRPRPQRGPMPAPKFMMRTSDPTRYWVGVRIPKPGGPPPRLPPTVLMLESDSLSAGGLFVDFTPWLLLSAVAIGFSVLLWFPVARSMTRALSKLTETTEQIAEGQFEAHAAVRRSDELGRLALAVNRLGDRLKGYVAGQKRFLGDIAHELCSPLARAEMALSILEQRVGAAHQESIEDVREEVRRMSDLVNELLSFSKAGLKAKEIRLAPVSLRPLAEKIIARESRGAELIVLEISPEIQALAEAELLGRALANLLRNALRYAGTAGPITISARADGTQVAICVVDRGPGVPEEALPKLGSPFYRPDAARTREEGGAGLGLAIVKTCAEACRGAVSFRNLRPSGFEATIRLDRP